MAFPAFAEVLQGQMLQRIHQSSIGMEPECVKKLYSDMFQSGSRTDDLLYESAVLASELDEGISFEDTLKSLRKRLGSRSESSTELTIETNEKKLL